MRRILCAVRDGKTETFLPGVLCLLTLAEAERTFLTLLRTPGTPVSEYPKDYSLYEIGMFDQESGEVFPVMDGSRIALPRKIADGGELLALVKEA